MPRRRKFPNMREEGWRGGGHTPRPGIGIETPACSKGPQRTVRQQ